MNNIYTVWANKRNSRNVKAFKSALFFRGKEDEAWEWSGDHKQSDLWILDIDHDPDSIEDCAVLYEQLAKKPAVAIMGVKPQETNTLPTKWKAFKSPIHVSEVFKWLDRDVKLSAADTSQLSTKAEAEKKPWHDHYFRLMAWPNIAQLGASNMNVTITCSNLLNRYYDFNSAQQWGLSPNLLDKLLGNAYSNAMLEINKEMDTKKEQVRNRKPNDQKNQSLIQKLLNRLK